MQHHTEPGEASQSRSASFLRNVTALVTGHSPDALSAARPRRHSLKKESTKTGTFFGRHAARPQRHTFSFHRERSHASAAVESLSAGESERFPTLPYVKRKRVGSNPEQWEHPDYYIYTSEQPRRAWSMSSPLLSRLRYVDELEAHGLGASDAEAQKPSTPVMERRIYSYAAVIEERPSLEDKAALFDNREKYSLPAYSSPPLTDAFPSSPPAHGLENIDEEVYSTRPFQCSDGSADSLVPDPSLVSVSPLLCPSVMASNLISIRDQDDKTSPLPHNKPPTDGPRQDLLIDFTVRESGSSSSSSPTSIMDEVFSMRQLTKGCFLCLERLTLSEFPGSTPTTACNHAADTCSYCLCRWIKGAFYFGRCNGVKCPQCSELLSSDDARRGVRVWF